MSGVLWQANPAWSTVKLGNGASTIGRSGCLLTCLTEAARTLSGRTGLLPPHANEICRTAKAFSSSNIIIDIAAKALGMESPAGEKTTGPLQALRIAIDDSLARGYAILHVDRDGLDGLDGGDHFILATKRMEDGSVSCLDPALATHVAIHWPDLEAAVRWGKTPKTYRVVAVRPLRAIAS